MNSVITIVIGVYKLIWR